MVILISRKVVGHLDLVRQAASAEKPDITFQNSCFAFPAVVLLLLNQAPTLIVPDFIVNEELGLSIRRQYDFRASDLRPDKQD